MMCRDAEAGFTLIELMISLALFALISLAGITLIDSVLGIQTRTEGRLERLADIQRAMFTLTSDLAQLTSGPVAGMGETISFSRPAAALGGIPVRVSYGLSGGAITRTLDVLAGGGTQQVLPGVAAVRWRFYQSGQGWVDRWPPSPDLTEWPLAVEAEIALEPAVPGPAGTLRRVVALPSRP
jgi:general secretion pathway protein J